MGRRFLWRAGRGRLGQRGRVRRARDRHVSRAAPSRRCSRRAEPIRRRIEAPDCPDDYQIIEELRAEGVTDYLIQPLPVHQRRGPRDQLDHAAAGRLHRRRHRRARSDPAAARARRRGLRAAPGRDHAARHLRRPRRRRAHPRGPDPARRHRAHRRRDPALRSARLHGAERPAAGRSGDRPAEQLLRLPGAGARRRTAARC